MDQLVALGAGDAGEVLTLQRAANVTEAQAHADLNLPPLRQSLPDLTSELTDSHVLALGLRDRHGRLVAAVRARTDEDNARVAEIGRLTVVPDRQGQGLGTRLLSAAEQQLPASVAELRLFTGEHSDGNLRLYGRLGFAETGRQLTPGGYDLIHLSKPRRVPG
jgi:ribosomal protein S18 acetylase RimI-like enzyme